MNEPNFNSEFDHYTSIERARQRCLNAKEALALAQIEYSRAKEELRSLREQEKAQKRQRYESLLERTIQSRTTKAEAVKQKPLEDMETTEKVEGVIKKLLG